jgi:hypothetical protein
VSLARYLLDALARGPLLDFSRVPRMAGVPSA